MPEISEVRIMSDFINQYSNIKFKKAFHVEKGNKPIGFIDKPFKINSYSKGKELLLFIDDLPIHIFMGMSGNWKYVETENWNQTKFIRFRLDDETGHSLLLYGGFIGPKYSIGKPFNGTKRGPDPTKEFDEFKSNIYKDIENKAFNKPICEVLLNQKYFNGVGTYLTAEIVGRMDLNPFTKFNQLKSSEIDSLLKMVLDCCNQSYEFGGGELKDWHNPFKESKVNEWLLFYGKKDVCCRYKFGTRNIWIQKKYLDFKS
jgi:endonuclease VIII-like 1